MKRTFLALAAVTMLGSVSYLATPAEVEARTVRECLDLATKYEERLDCYAVQDRNTERTYRPKKEDKDKSEPSKPDHSTPTTPGDGGEDPTKPGEHGPGKGESGDNGTGDEGGVKD